VGGGGRGGVEKKEEGEKHLKREQGWPALRQAGKGKKTAEGEWRRLGNFPWSGGKNGPDKRTKGGGRYRCEKKVSANTGFENEFRKEMKKYREGAR